MAAPTDDEAVAVGANVILRWDGQRWQRSATPRAVFYDVSASGPDDVWAVGTPLKAPGPLVFHWVGTRWQQVSLPPISQPPSGGGIVLFSEALGVLALTPTDVWVVGGAPAFALHWDGTTWTSYAMPPSRFFDHVRSVVALSSNDIWAIGDGTTVEWTGRDWVVRAVQRYDLPGITARDGELWQADFATLRRWDGTSWTPFGPRGRTVGHLTTDLSGSVWALTAKPRGGYSIVRYDC